MGELMSVLDLLRSTRQVEEPLRILCDSQYAINCCTRWIPSWKKRGWRKADNKPVMNLELLQQLDQELEGRRVSFQWVKGHAGHPLNEKADDLARAAATAYQQGTPLDSGPGFGKAPVRAAGGSATDQAGAAPDLPAPVPDGDRAGVGETTGHDPATGEAASAEAGVGGNPTEAQGSSDELGPVLEATGPADTVLIQPEPPEPLRPGQPDLLSVGYIAPRSQRVDPERDLVVEVTELTRELMSDETQLDLERLDELMHPDYVVHMPGGTIRTRGSIMARPAVLTGTVQMTVIGADLLDGDILMLRYKMRRNSQDFLCVALWQRKGLSWQVRFQQYTVMG